MNPMHMGARLERMLRAQARAERSARRVKGVRQLGTEGQVGLTVSMHADPALVQRLEQLAPKVQQRFARRATRAALGILKRIAVPLYARHRTNKPRAHLDESITVVTRSYRGQGGGVSWGALGFKMPGAWKTEHGEYDAAGWRAHFFEDGFTATGGIRHGLGAGNLRDVRGRFDRGPGRSVRSAVRASVKSGAGRWVPGRRYLPIVKRMGEPLMIQTYRHALAELIRTAGKRIGRTPRSILHATRPSAVLRGARP